MRGNHLEKFRWTRKRIVSAILSAALLFACIGFSTYAWLTSRHDPVVNEFTGSKLVLTLSPDADQGPYRLVPGQTYELSDAERPNVKIEGGSVECYLFFVYEEINNTYYSPFLSYEDVYYWDLSTIGTANHTLQPTEDTGIVYVIVPQIEQSLPLGVVPAEDQAQNFEFIYKITIPETITKQQVHPSNFISGGGTEVVPKFKVAAYAIQTFGFKGKNTGGTAEENAKADLRDAWAVVEAAIKSGSTKDVVLN